MLDSVLCALLDRGAGRGLAIDQIVASLRVEVLAVLRVAQVRLQGIEFQAVKVIGNAVIVIVHIHSTWSWQVWAHIGLALSKINFNQD